MVTQEIVKNPVLEESTGEAGEEVTADELLPLLEAETTAERPDKELLEASNLSANNSLDGAIPDVAINGNLFPDAEENAAVAEALVAAPVDPIAETPAATDPFDEID